MNVVKMDDTTWRLEDDFVYCYLLVGEEKAMLIDTGAFGSDVKSLVEGVTDLPVILVNTHGDGDHIAGNGFFPEFYMNREDYDNQRVADRVPSAVHRDLSDGDVFELGGRRVSALAVPGHTYGSMVFLDESRRTLFSGDTVQDSNIFMFGEHRCPERFADSLQALKEKAGQYDTICASHGTPVLPGDFAEKVLEDWMAVLEKKIEGVPTDVHGNKVLCYRGSFCGFLMQ